MSSQCLSDEAVAACADGVLAGHARDRATRHLAECAECAHAVRVQREAAWALRAAPAPSLPTGLLDRLRTVADDSPLTLPGAVDDDGTMLTPTVGPMAAAIVPPARPADAEARAQHRGWTSLSAAVHLFRSDR